METKTKTKSKFWQWVLGIYLFAVFGIFLAVAMIVDYIVWETAEGLKKVSNVVNPPTELTVNIEAAGFLDYFIRFQALIVIFGIVAFVLVIYMLRTLVRGLLVPYWNRLREERREKWRIYLNSGQTIDNLTDEQKNGINLRGKALDYDLYVAMFFGFAIFLVVGVALAFLNLGNVGTENDQSISVIFIIGVGFIFFLTLVWLRDRNKPINTIERKIKSDVEWQEFLDGVDKEKEESKKE
ncbi:MAG: hypothetical protein ACW990_00210 [Promethearchaeota archaeon]|jgi:hypothetical protein